MAVSRREAKPLCTASEFALANESYPPEIGRLSAKELRQRITRVRRLRDKFTDLVGQQVRVIRGKAASTRRRVPTANANTILKRDFFAETLERFEARLGIVERREVREAEKAEKQKANAALKTALKRKKARGPAAQKSTRKASKGMRSVPSRKREEFPNLPAMSGATRATHARKQAKRDNRNAVS